jgi:hypothetical protein
VKELLVQGPSAQVALAISVVGLVVSGFSAYFAATQSKHASRSTAMAITQSFLSETRELWSECSSVTKQDPVDYSRFRTCVEHVLAQFEFACALLCEDFISGKLYNLIDDAIVDYVDLMAESGYIPTVKAMTVQAHVCENLKDFCVQRGQRFRNKAAVFDMLNISRWAA